MRKHHRHVPFSTVEASLLDISASYSLLAEKVFRAESRQKETSEHVSVHTVYKFVHSVSTFYTHYLYTVYTLIVRTILPVRISHGIISPVCEPYCGITICVAAFIELLRRKTSLVAPSSRKNECLDATHFNVSMLFCPLGRHNTPIFIVLK